MTMMTRSWLGLLVIVMLAVSLGLLIRNAESQEGEEEARPIVVAEEASGEDPFGAPKPREREERERPEAEKRERGERPTERDIVKHHIEVFKIALHGLMEAEKKDAADVLQRAIRAREVTLEGRRDEEAHMIRERAPSRGQLAEILMLASNLWREFDNKDKAEVTEELAKVFAAEGKRERGRERPVPERRESEGRERPRTDGRSPELVKRHQELERQALEIKRALEGLRDDQDEEARELQAKLREVTAKLHELQRARRGPEGVRDDLLGRLHELEKALVRAREAGGSEEEIVRIQRQMAEVRQHMEGRVVRRPPATSVMRVPAEVERLKGTVREMNEQMTEMRREMAQMRELLEKLIEQQREDR